MLLATLDEMYRARVETSGAGAARSWYRREVMAFVLHVPSRMIKGPGMGRVSGMDAARSAWQVVRRLARAPGFSAVAVVTLAVGIGANALIFAIVDRALFRPLPYPEPQTLVSVLDGRWVSAGILEILDREMSTVEALGGAWDAIGMTLEPPEGGARRVSVARAFPGYLRAVGVTPVVGRLFEASESSPETSGVALLGYDFWQTAFGGDAGVLGTSIRLEGEARRVVGILPRGFDLPSARNDIWIPGVMNPADPGRHWGTGSYRLVGRLRPGATAEQVRQELLQLAEPVRRANPLWTPPADHWAEARVIPLQQSRGREARTPLLILLGAVGVVLLVVCANVANLLLSRGLATRHELAICSALGAGRWRLAGSRLVEAAVLALAGTAAGLGIAAVGLDLVRPFLPPEVPGAAQATLDLRVVLMTTGLALMVAVLAGAIPAVRSAQAAPGAVLRDEGRGQAGSRSRRVTTRVLVATQMAAAVVLVSGAGLLVRSLVELGRVETGFAVEDRVTARLDLPPGLPDDLDAGALYLDRLLEALGAEPAFDRVALASTIPFAAVSEGVAAFIPGVTEDRNVLPYAQHRRVTPGFFAVAGIPLLEGRTFDASDRLGSPLVAIVDEAFVRELMDGEDPVGRTVQYPWRGAPDMEIVGVVGSTMDGDLGSEPAPTLWVPMAQMGLGRVGYTMVLAEARTGSAQALSAIHEATRRFDDRMAVSELETWASLLSSSLKGTRLLTVLLIVFASSTLALGCVGVYGVVSFSLRERLGEIGIRMTLGADPRRIRARVLGEGLRMAVPGAAVGVAVAVLAGRLLDRVLFGVGTADPVTLVVAPIVLVGSAAIAVYLPSRRATRVDPARVLRGT